MYTYQQAVTYLLDNQQTWLVTGAAGFIGSNLVEKLLKLNQKVIGLDNLSSGFLKNFDDIKNNVTENQWNLFKFHHLDINNISNIKSIFNTPIDFVLHHAALCSVPLSIKNPELCYATNINGFNNIIELSAQHFIKAFVYASSSAVYGDNTDSLKTEENIGKPLSPYAISKYNNELSAQKYSNDFNLATIGFRYFNVYGKRQSINSEYSAVIPKWLNTMLNNQSIYINGDGSTTRDFCNIDDVVQANILACVNLANNHIKHAVYNIGTGDAISLSKLYQSLQHLLTDHQIYYSLQPEYRDFLNGDIMHSCADISKAKHGLNFKPEFMLDHGLIHTFNWYHHLN